MILQLGKKFIIPQWLAGIGVTALLLHIGFMGGWASPTLVRLSAPDSPLRLSADEASWIASLLNVGRFLGSVLGATANYCLGSKRAVLATTLPVAFGWLAVVVATDAGWLYASRLSSGIGLGMTFVTAPLYLGEVSMPEIRGALVSLAMLGAPVGQVISSACGSYLEPRDAGALYLALALLLSALFYWLPESPHHLLKIGAKEAARKSVDWYRSGRGVEQELEAVEQFLRGATGSWAEKLREFAKPAVRWATIKILALFALAQWCGLNVVMIFMESILISAGFRLTEPALVVIYANICSVLSSIASIFLIDRCGRKSLLVMSSLGTTVSLAGLTAHFGLLATAAGNSYNDDTTTSSLAQWLPLISCCLFMFAYFLGLLAVPSTVLGEIFPNSIKCAAACAAILAAAASAFVSTKTYQPMVEALGEAYVFGFYTLVSAIVVPYAVFFVPETKGKSLQEIQDEMTAK